MARPCKSAHLLTEHSQTLEETAARAQREDSLKGGDSPPKPPAFLSDGQRKVFKKLVNLLKTGGVLGPADVYVLTLCAIAVDRLWYIEDRINDSPELLLNAPFMASKDKYTKDLFRCANELSLSPQSRAKLANLGGDAKQQDQYGLLKLLKGGVVSDT